MALIKCPECGKEVSSAAVTCIGCGYPIAANMAKITGVVSQNANTFKKVVTVISPELNWSVLGAYCNDIVSLHYIIFMAQMRAKNYEDAFHEVENAFFDKIEKNGITWEEMVELYDNGGTQSLVEEGDQIRETAQYKKWIELNKRAGEINDELGAISKKMNATKDHISELESVLAIRRGSIERIQNMLGMCQSLNSNSVGIFSKIKNSARENEIRAELNEAKADVAHFTSLIAQEERTLKQFEQEYDAWGREFDRVADERETYDAYVNRSREIWAKIDGYNACRELYEDYLVIYEKMSEDDKKLEQIIDIAEKKLKSRYDLNIIPTNYRNFQCMLWLSKYVNSSQPTDLAQLLALMSLQQINEQLQETNVLLAQMANNQEKQLETLNSVKEQVLQLRKEQQEAKECYIAAIENLRQTIYKGQQKQAATINAGMTELVKQLEETQRLSQEQISISEEQLRECRNCANMLDSIAYSERDFHKDALNAISKMSLDTHYLKVYC